RPPAPGPRGGCLAGLRVVQKKFVEPVALSSTSPTDVPLPRTAARRGFDLIALRARRRWESRGCVDACQEGRAENLALFADNGERASVPRRHGHGLGRCGRA